MSHFQNGRKKEGAVKSATVSFMILSSEMSAGVSKHLQGCPFCNLPTDLRLNQSLSSADGAEEEQPPAGGEEGCGGRGGEGGGGHKQLNGALTENKGCGCRVHIFKVETLNCSFEAGTFL